MTTSRYREGAAFPLSPRGWGITPHVTRSVVKELFTSLLAILELCAHFGETDRTNAPVAAHERKQARRRSEQGGEGGDQIDNLLGGRVGATHGDGAGELGYLGNVGPGGREVAVERGADLDAAHFDAPSLVIGGAGLFIPRLGVSEVGSQIVIQGGLIGFDRQHDIALPGAYQGQKSTWVCMASAV